ncbi:MAG: hypothetical protein AAF677_02625 [Pseudomonadota bacterium]
MVSFSEAANRHGTDKGTLAGAAHGYSVVYDLLFAPYQSRRALDVLEIGLAIGGPELGGDVDRCVAGAPSLGMWFDCLDDPKIVGFDISDFKQFENDRFTFIRGDSGRTDDLKRVHELGRQFDIILDDGSHASFHQQVAMGSLFHLLKPGGLYVIEDLSWQPAEIESDLPGVPRTAKLLTDFVQSSRFEANDALDQDAARRLEEMISGVFLYDESELNSLAANYNARQGLPSIDRRGWRGRSGIARMSHAHFWLFAARRFMAAVQGSEFATWQAVKLAILQRRPE